MPSSVSTTFSVFWSFVPLRLDDLHVGRHALEERAEQRRPVETVFDPLADHGSGGHLRGEFLFLRRSGIGRRFLFGPIRLAGPFNWPSSVLLLSNRQP